MPKSVAYFLNGAMEQCGEGGGVMKGEKSVQKLYLFHLFSLFYTSQQGQKF